MDNNDTVRWIKATLANDEYSTDAELFDHFCSQGVDPAEAQAWIARREDFLGSI
jgi:hypothetical protein